MSNDKTNGYWYGFDCSKCLGEQNSKTKGYTGANCNISCENNYCNNHGQCLGEQTCTCDNKYTGDTCNKCMDNVIDEKGDGSLCQTCKDGFTGENCEIIAIMLIIVIIKVFVRIVNVFVTIIIEENFVILIVEKRF